MLRSYPFYWICFHFCSIFLFRARVRTCIHVCCISCCFHYFFVLIPSTAFDNINFIFLYGYLKLCKMTHLSSCGQKLLAYKICFPNYPSLNEQYWIALIRLLIYSCFSTATFHHSYFRFCLFPIWLLNHVTFTCLELWLPFGVLSFVLHQIHWSTYIQVLYFLFVVYLYS